MSSFDETTETPSIPSDPLVGALIDGKYRVLGPLAQGGMARIYRAEQEPLGRIVALKALMPTPGSADAKLFKDRFFREASTCARLKHPNTVTLFDYGLHADTGAYFMIMEMVDGRSVSEALKDEGLFHPIRALTIAIEICRSLQEAHQLGIIHRDLKPSNVMLTETLEGEGVKVLDFGIAKLMQVDSQSITMEDRIVGSPRYMSPEQISQGPIDQRTDVYALGIMLFEMISGRAPFSGHTPIQTLMKHVNQPVPLLSTHTPSTLVVHPDLDALVAACMAKDPKMRPGSVDQLKQQLRETLAKVADSTEDMRMSTESVVRHALSKQAFPPAVEHSSPTLSRPLTDESTFTQAAPVVLGIGGLTVVSLGALLVAGVAIVALAWTWMSSTSEAPVQAPVPVPETVATPAPARPVLSIRSQPEGAEVWEGTTRWGVTPLDHPVKAGSAPRFELRLEGHQSVVVEPGRVDGDQVLNTTLAPIPASAPAPAKPRPAPDDGLDVIDRR